MNAIIGDNGIITNAQQASWKTGMATLEEWLQEEYVKYYDDIENYNNIKQELLASKHDNLFLKDSNRNYIITEGKVYYLINKTSLPKEVRDVLHAGDTTEYSKYTRLIDVYGVSDDLKVFYYNSEDGTIYGTLAASNIDISKIKAVNINTNSDMKDLITRELAKYNVIPSDEGISMSDVTSITDLDIDCTTISMTDLNSLTDLKNLKTLTLSNANLSSLSGIEGCPGLYYLYLRNCKINDYSSLASVLKLQYLYIYMSEENLTETESNNQITNLGNGLKDAKLSKLQYLSVSGTEDFVVGNLALGSYSGTGKSNLSDISGLATINDFIKEKVLYLSVDCNKIASISDLEGYNNVIKVNLNGNSYLTSLNGLADTKDLEYLYSNSSGLTSLSGLKNSGLINFYFWRNNNLHSLDGLEDCKNLSFIYAVNCDLTDISALNGMTSVHNLILNNNINLEEITVLGTLTGLGTLRLVGNVNMIESQVKSALADSGIAAQCGTNFEYPPKYTKYFSAISTWLDYSYATLGVKLTTENSDWINIKNRTNVIGLNLDGQDELTNDDLQETLGTMSGLRALVLNGCSNLASINFITTSGMTLEELDLRSTKSTLTDLSPLNAYNAKLKRVIINNTSIDIDGIQSSIEKMYDLSDREAGYSFYSTSSWACSGLILLGNLGQYDFSGCTTLGRLAFKLHSSVGNKIGNYSNTLDLSECSNLQKVRFGYLSCNVLLPSNDFNSIIIDNCDFIKFSEGLSVKTLESINGKNSANYWFSNILETSTNKPMIKEITFTRYIPSDWGFMTKLNKNSLEYFSFDGQTYSNSFTNLSGLSGCTNLEKCVIKNADGLTSLTGIETCSKLWYFELSKTSVNDVSKLSQLTQLKGLYLTNNKYLKNISGLSNLKNLQTTYNSDGSVYKAWVNLSDNKIDDLSPLLGLIVYSSENDTVGKIKFSKLDLSNNNIDSIVSATNSNIETLLKLKNAGLTELKLSGNNLTREQGARLEEAFGSGLTITYTDDE